MTQYISPLQLLIIFVNIAFGAGMLTLPRSVADAAREDMWMSVIVGGVLMLIAFWFSANLSRHFPQHTCFEYFGILLGPVLGQVLNIIFLCLIVSITAMALRIFATAIKMFLLDFTPPIIIVLFLLLLAVYAVQYGITPVIRMQQCTFVFNYVIFLFFILLGFLAVSARYYKPVLAEGMIPVLKGAMPSWFAYTGPELIILAIYPWVTRKNKVLKYGFISIIILMTLFTIITLVVQGIFGPNEAAYVLVPTIEAFKSVEIPDTFVERLDGYLMIFWISIYFTSLANLYYLISLGVGRVLNLEYNRPLAIFILPLIWYIASVPPNFQTVLSVGKALNMAGMIWGLAIVPCLLVIARIRKKRGREC